MVIRRIEDRDLPFRTPANRWPRTSAESQSLGTAPMSTYARLTQHTAQQSPRGMQAPGAGGQASYGRMSQTTTQHTSTDFDFMPSNLMPWTSQSPSSMFTPTPTGRGTSERTWTMHDFSLPPAFSTPTPGEATTPRRSRYCDSGYKSRTEPSFANEYDPFDWGRRRGPSSVVENNTRNEVWERTSFPSLAPPFERSSTLPFSIATCSPPSTTTTLPSFMAPDFGLFTPPSSQPTASSPSGFMNDWRKPPQYGSDLRIAGSGTGARGRKFARASLRAEERTRALRDIGSGSNMGRSTGSLLCDVDGCNHPPMKCQSDLKFVLEFLQ